MTKHITQACTPELPNYTGGSATISPSSSNSSVPSVEKGKLVVSMETLQGRMDRVSPQCIENLSPSPTVHVQIYAAAETTGQVPGHIGR